jgi:hypothetical protein
MTVTERRHLLLTSVPKDPENPRSRRYNIRRSLDGIACFEAKFTRDVGADVEFHGYPCSSVPIKVLRVFRDEGRITDAEYRGLARSLGW